MNIALCLLATFACLWATAATQSVFSAPSEKVLSFASLLSARVSNGNQVCDEEEQVGDSEHDKVILYFKPVDIPFFEPNITVLYIEKLNGTWRRNLLYVLGEDGHGKIQVHGYFLKGEVREGDLSSLREDDVTFSDECTAHLQQYGKALFYGTWPTCSTADEKAHPRYAVTLTCESFTSTVDDPDFPESDSDIPYVLYVKERYPLLQYSLRGVPDFKPPCDE